jgi:hypothetical protein
MNALQIQSIKPLEGKRIWVKFKNGVEKIYGCTQILHIDVFQNLNNEALFKTAKVDPGG